MSAGPSPAEPSLAEPQSETTSPTGDTSSLAPRAPAPGAALSRRSVLTAGLTLAAGLVAAGCSTAAAGASGRAAGTPSAPSAAPARLPATGTPSWPVDVRTAQPTAPWSMYATQGGRVELVTFGADIWLRHDVCGYYYAPASGDGEWSCRVAVQSDTKSWAKAGLMLRASTQPSSSMLDLVVTPANGLNLNYRQKAGQFAKGFPAVDPMALVPVYLRLRKQGHTYTCWDSPDGVHWHNAVSHTLSPDVVGSRYLVGLCGSATSYSGTRQGLAGFDRIQGFKPTTYAALIDRHGNRKW